MNAKWDTVSDYSNNQLCERGAQEVFWILGRSLAELWKCGKQVLFGCNKSRLLSGIEVVKMICYSQKHMTSTETVISLQSTSYVDFTITHLQEQD